MRHVVRSRTYLAHLKDFMERGAEQFGVSVAERTLGRIDCAIEQVLANHPMRLFDKRLGLSVYFISRTPFTLLYDFDEIELRVHFIVPARADRTRIDPATVEW